MTVKICSFCSGAIGPDVHENQDGSFRHYSPLDCADVLKIQRNAYKAVLEAIRPKANALLMMSKAMDVRYDIAQLSEIVELVDKSTGVRPTPEKAVAGP